MLRVTRSISAVVAGLPTVPLADPGLLCAESGDPRTTWQASLRGAGNAI
jgi:hypothetical protein